MSDDKVVPLRLVKTEPRIVEETQDPCCDDVLDAARGRLEDVLVVGWGKEDGRLWVASSPLNFGQVIELLELAKDLYKHERNLGD